MDLRKDGNDALPFNNLECFGNIDWDGVYNFPTPITGKNAEITRTGSIISFNLSELRAYRWNPIDKKNIVLTANLISNPALINSVDLVSSTLKFDGIKWNTLF